MARTKTTARLASSSGAQPSSSAPSSPSTSATPSTSTQPGATLPPQGYAQAYQWAPLHLLAETSSQLPADHLATLLKSVADEPSCALDKEDDRNLGVRIPPEACQYVWMIGPPTGCPSPSSTQPSSRGCASDFPSPSSRRNSSLS